MKTNKTVTFIDAPDNGTGVQGLFSIYWKRHAIQGELVKLEILQRTLQERRDNLFELKKHINNPEQNVMGRIEFDCLTITDDEVIVLDTQFGFLNDGLETNEESENQLFEDFISAILNAVIRDLSKISDKIKKRKDVLEDLQTESETLDLLDAIKVALEVGNFERLENNEFVNKTEYGYAINKRGLMDRLNPEEVGMVELLLRHGMYDNGHAFMAVSNYTHGLMAFVKSMRGSAESVYIFRDQKHENIFSKEAIETPDAMDLLKKVIYVNPIVVGFNKMHLNAGIPAIKPIKEDGSYTVEEMYNFVRRFCMGLPTQNGFIDAENAFPEIYEMARENWWFQYDSNMKPRIKISKDPCSTSEFSTLIFDQRIGSQELRIQNSDEINSINNELLRKIVKEILSLNGVRCVRIYSHQLTVFNHNKLYTIDDIEKNCFDIFRKHYNKAGHAVDFV